MKLLKKSNQLYLLMFSILFIVAGFLIYTLLGNTISQEVDEKLLTNKNRIVNQLKNNQRINSIPPIIELVQLSNKSVSISIYKDTLILDEVEEDEEYFRELSAIELVDENYYQITVRQVILQPHDIFNSIGIVLIIVFGALLMGIMLLNRYISNRIWHPFYKTLSTIKSFSLNQKEKVGFDQSNIQEFSELNQDVEALISKIQSDYHSLKSFTENASHELQTPLAVIRAKLDEMAQQKDLSEEVFGLIIPINAAVEKLSRMNKALLLLTKIENSQFGEDSEISIDKILENNIMLLDDFIEQKKINLEVKYGNVRLISNPLLVEILLSNLLSNAVKHNLDSGWIKVELNQNTLSISNSGKEYNGDVNHLFNRFSKSDANSESLGLGLAISHSICKALNWDINYHIKAESHQFTVHF